MLIRSKKDRTRDSLISSSELRFSKTQKIAAVFLFVALVALSAQVIQLTTKPEATLRSIADSDDATGNAFFTQRETLVLAINFERWMSGNETKRAVLIRRSLLGQRLNVKDAAGVTNAERASADYLQALEEIDSCLANEDEGVLIGSRQMAIRSECGGSLETLTFEARQLGIEISNAGDVRLREIIRRDRENRDSQIFQLLSIVGLILGVGGLLGVSRTRALNRIRRVIEDDQEDLKNTRDSLALLEAQIEERIEIDKIQRAEDQRLDTEMRAIITELRNATDSENAITALANGIHRLIHSEITFVQFFAGAEDRDLASLKRGDTSATFDFGNQGIDREFSSEMSKVAQKIWHESEAGSVSIKEISDSLSTNALNELKKLGLDESSVIMPVSEGQVVLGYVVFKNSDNGLLPPNQLSAVQSAVGQAANSIGAIRSSSLVQRIRENEQVVSELRALDRLKDEFTANVNHELRTPLTSIIGYLELVLSDSQNLPAATLDYLETVRRNADRLTELIERLLVVARSDSQSEVLMRTEVDLAQVIRDAVQVVGQKDSTKSVDIKIKIDDGHFNIFGDKLRLEQIVVNLVSNAVKFSKSYSTVFVELRRMKSAIGGNPEVELTIRDSGIGIPANETANLFNRFFRASNATKALIPGTGLGLSIVKQFVEDHDGNISINSVVGQGTTVSVRLPLAPIKLV